MKKKIFFPVGYRIIALLITLAFAGYPLYLGATKILADVPELTIPNLVTYISNNIPFVVEFAGLAIVAIVAFVGLCAVAARLYSSRIVWNSQLLALLVFCASTVTNIVLFFVNSGISFSLDNVISIFMLSVGGIVAFVGALISFIGLCRGVSKGKKTKVTNTVFAALFAIGSIAYYCFMFFEGSGLVAVSPLSIVFKNIGEYLPFEILKGKEQVGWYALAYAAMALFAIITAAVAGKKSKDDFPIKAKKVKEDKPEAEAAEPTAATEENVVEVKNEEKPAEENAPVEEAVSEEKSDEDVTSIENEPVAEESTPEEEKPVDVAEEAETLTKTEEPSEEPAPVEEEAIVAEEAKPEETEAPSEKPAEEVVTEAEPVEQQVEEEAEPSEESTPAEETAAEEPAPVEKEPTPVAEEPSPAPVKQAPKAKPAPVKTRKVDDVLASRVYHVSKRAEDQMWTVKFAGGQKSLKLFRTKNEAVAFANDLAMKNGSTVLIHASKGKNAGKIAESIKGPKGE